MSFESNNATVVASPRSTDVPESLGQVSSDASVFLATGSLAPAAENGGGPRARHSSPAGNLYNVIKALARDADLPAAQAKLVNDLKRWHGRLDQKNSKGSTALHACAYLKRWDFAKALLDAGASPIIRNAAGHTFFLTAVRDSSAPWSDLFAGHPDLIEKHRRYLERSSGSARASSGESRPARAPKEPLVTKQNFDERGFSECAPSVLALWLRGEGGGDERLVDAMDLSPAVILGIEDQWKLLRDAPKIVLWRALAAGVRIDPAVQDEVLAAIPAHDEWLNEAFAWGPACAGGDCALQLGLLERFLRAKQEPLIRSLAHAGWRYDDDFIEQCEEAGCYDLADDLIEARATARIAPPSLASVKSASRVSGERASSRPQATKGLPKASNQKKSNRQKIRKGGGGGASAARKGAMIANLDRPMREANEFEYSERKPQAKATIIIVKKARPVGAVALASVDHNETN